MQDAGLIIVSKTVLAYQKEQNAGSTGIIQHDSLPAPLYNKLNWLLKPAFGNNKKLTIVWYADAFIKYTGMMGTLYFIERDR